MPQPPPSAALSSATFADLCREAWRRLDARLAWLPDGSRWTRMDWALSALVVALALGSTGFFTATYRVFSNDPDYYARRAIAALETRPVDPIQTGAIGGGAAAADPADGAIAVPVLVRHPPLVPSDYEIVMIFGEEAFLASPRELFRAKVGSVLPGLGRMLSLDAGALRFENATLEAVER